MTELFAGVLGQPSAVAALKAAARRPVHAYLLVGPPGVGKSGAARDFAAALLCPQGGDGSCETCRRVVGGVHPDVVMVAREGASITIDAAREVARVAARSPVEGARKVLILSDFHLVKDAGPALLKTIEEPPASAIFLITAEYVPPELVTVASRCVQINFASLTAAQVAEVLVAEGVDPEAAQRMAETAGGRLDRARLLASDPAFEDRRHAWREVPNRLDGSGATAAVLADELLALLDESVKPLEVRQAEEVAQLEARNVRAAEVNGKVGRAGRGTLNAGVRELEERHRREARRQRTDELRSGLASLAAVYRDRLVGGNEPSVGSALEALTLIQAMAANLMYNPNELLSLQALLVRLG